MCRARGLWRLVRWPISSSGAGGVRRGFCLGNGGRCASFACRRLYPPAMILSFSWPAYCACVCAVVYVFLQLGGPKIGRGICPTTSRQAQTIGLLTRLARGSEPNEPERTAVNRLVAGCAGRDATSRARAIRRQELGAVELGRDARCWRRAGPDWRRRRARSCSFVSLVPVVWR